MLYLILAILISVIVLGSFLTMIVLCIGIFIERLRTPADKQKPLGLPWQHEDEKIHFELHIHNKTDEAKS